MLDVSRTSRLWQPPQRLEKREMVAISDAVLAEPEIDFNESEDLFRIHANGLDWDIGNVVYAPKDERRIAVGPDGKKLGIFMTHGGASDWRSIERLARTFCGKRGFKVCSMTYPGRFYLGDPSRDWPDDTFHADGTVRTPIWLKDEIIGADEYEVKIDASNLVRLRRHYQQAACGVVPGYPDLFACGDCAAVPDLTRPGAITGMTAQHAERQGRHAARNVAASLAGRELTPYRHHDLGFLVDLGGFQAAANPLQVPLSGPPAKFVTRGYHLYSLPGNRTRTAADWAINTVMPPRAVQLGLVGAERVRLESID